MESTNCICIGLRAGVFFFDGCHMRDDGGSYPGCAIDSGMDAHIAKPVQIDKLKATIRQVPENRAAAKNKG